MKFLCNDYNLTIDFESPEAAWSLLVIDDKWDAVKSMVCGLVDPETNHKYQGLAEKCVDYYAVEEYWNSAAFTVVETFERALLLLPWMVYGTEGYGKIIFCGFPTNVRSLQEIFLGHSDEGKDENIPYSQWAVMIDIIDQSDGDREKFTKTWRLLDKSGHPAYARSKLTRGGVTVDRQFDEVEKILKETPTGGDNAHKDLVRNWLLRVSGKIAADKYQQLTLRSCHNPSDLKRTTLAERRTLCDLLAIEDLYGVWRWCRKSAALDPLPDDAPRRWLACKAFQTWPGDYPNVPVTAIIAICEGTNILCTGECHQSQITVVSDLATIRDNDDRLLALGQITLKSGNYQSFATSLRDWLTLSEQYEEGKAHIHEVKISRPSTDDKLRLEFSFTGKLPQEIFTPPPGSRLGRATRAWQQLRGFSSSTDVSANPIVTLLFDYSS
jgi:hypothetical protein